MSHEFDYKRDRYFFPVEVTASTNQLVVDEQDGSGQKTVTITPRERYYTHEDPSEDGTIGYALLHEIKTAMNAQLVGTYEFAVGTPPGAELVGTGLRFFRQDAGNFAFVFSSNDWTFDQRLLGFGADPPGSSGTLDNQTAPYSVFGEWVTQNEIDGAASEKMKTPDRYTASSTERAKSAATRRFYADKIRPILYEWVPGACVRENRAYDATSAQTAGLVHNDVNNALEAMFDLFTAPTSDADIPRVVIVHGGGGIDRQSVYANEPYEVAQLKPIDGQLSEPGALWDVVRMAGEYYNVSMIWEIEQGTYRQ